MFAMPTELFVKTAASASVVVCIFILVQLTFEKMFGFYSLIPEQLREERGKLWVLVLIAVEVMLYAIGPTVFYFWIYTLLPFFSFRAGIGVAIFLYMFGSLPYALSLALRMKIPGGVLIFTLFFNLLKLTACWATITYLMNS